MILFLKHLLKARSTDSVGAVSLIFKWEGKRWSGFKITKNVINNAHTLIAFKSSMQAVQAFLPLLKSLVPWMPGSSLENFCSTVLQKNVCLCWLGISFSKISGLTCYTAECLFISNLQIHSLQVAVVWIRHYYICWIYISCVQCPFHVSKQFH